MTAYDDGQAVFYQGDALTVLRELPDESVNCVVTSPPYWGLRDYGCEGQIGLEETPALYLERMVAVFSEVRRVLRSDGTAWVNIGDSYNAYNGGAGPSSKLSQNQSEQRPRLATGYGLQCKELKPKDLIGMPWMLAFALRSDGWYLRSEIIWHKPNPMPESVTDRPTKSHEQLFLLTKSARYWYDADAIREPAEWARWGAQTTIKDYRGINPVDMDSLEERRTEGRNKRDVWTVATEPYPEAHFATFPEALIEPCILAGCPAGGVVLDPFLGSGTTAAVARRLGRRAVGIELNPDYLEMAKRRCHQMGLFSGAAS